MRTRILTALIVASFLHSVFAEEIFVSTQGRDDWTGKRSAADLQHNDGPFRTPSRAQAEVEKLFNRGAKSIIVTVGRGTYYLAEPITVRGAQMPQDARLIYRSAPGETATLSAGRSIEHCIAIESALVRCDVDSLKLTSIRTHADGNSRIPAFELFLQDRRRLPLARWPNATGAQHGGWAYAVPTVNPDSKTTFSIARLKGKRWQASQDVLVHIWSQASWFDEYLRVETVDFDTGTVRLRNPALYPVAAGSRFYFLNVAEELDAQGEWRYSEGERAVYAGVSEAEARDLTVSYLENVFRLENAHGVTLQHLNLRHSRGAAVVIEGGASNTIEDCDIGWTGGAGIRISGQDNGAERNVIHDVGLEGIALEGGDRRTLSAGMNYARENEVLRFGEVLNTHHPGIAIFGVGHIVSGNRLHEGPNIGIQLRGNDHRIERNELYDLCLESADCGAIYSGRDWTFRGNVIQGNSVHDIPGYGLRRVDAKSGVVEYGSPDLALGIYLDDAVSGFTVAKNLVYRIGRYGILIGGGRDNIVRNNIVVDSPIAFAIDARWPGYPWQINIAALDAVPYLQPPWSDRYPALAAPMKDPKWPEGNDVSQNVFARTGIETCEYPLVDYAIPKESTRLSRNLLWSKPCAATIQAKVLETGTSDRMSSGAWLSKGIEKGTQEADPEFVNQIADDYRLLPSSPALQMGFVPLLQLPNSKTSRVRRTLQRFDFLGDAK